MPPSFKDLLSTWCPFREIEGIPVLPIPNHVRGSGEESRKNKVDTLSLLCPDQRELEGYYDLILTQHVSK